MGWLAEILPDDVLMPLITVSSLTTTAGTNAYALPTDLIRIVSVTMGGFPAYEMDSDEAVRASIWNPDYKPATYNDSIWYIRNGKIEFIPTPYETGLAIVINYLKEPADLSADTGAGSTPVLYARYHDLIAEQATYLVLLKDRERVADADKYATSVTNQVNAVLAKYGDTHALTKVGREANK